MSILLVFLILLFIVFVPIPIKLTIHVSEGDFYIKLYNILLLSPEEGIINKLIKKLSINNSSNHKKESINHKRKYKKHTHNPSYRKVKSRFFSPIKLYRKLTTNKFKPKFKLKGAINFELEDAAITAITYGLASNIHPLLYFGISKFFNVKLFSLKIIPHFTGKNLFNFTINSIISFNIAQIIYILILTITSFENKKEVGP